MRFCCFNFYYELVAKTPPSMRYGVSRTGLGTIHLLAPDVHYVLLKLRTAASVQKRAAPTFEHVSTNPAMHEQ